MYGLYSILEMFFKRGGGGLVSPTIHDLEPFLLCCYPVIASTTQVNVRGHVLKDWGLLARWGEIKGWGVLKHNLGAK